jgi:2-C-methyl-D-erythritol 4-phosphate cytidylyltransferase
MTIFAIIVAGGSSARFNKNNQSSLPKQYIKIFNTPIIKITVEKFLSNQKINKIIIVIRKEDEQLINKIFQYEIESNKVFTTHGGKERINSTINGLNYINANFPNQCNYVMIHDAARPLVSDKIIDDSINKIQNSNYEAVFPIININEALKYIDDFKITSINRNQYFTAQTPQTFKFNAITECIEKYQNSNCDDKTIHDEIMLAEQYDLNIGYIDGCKKNIKITTEDDLGFVEFLIGKNKNI